ncbi:hypothetical protein AJ79_00760 [Helicocarpus griseus UAMH5409]|uniref:Uncharacterized protein n=1 Tax=Helicocarpus griseus UAMH5409 TaxID=1447875 RepID=A0A2B7YB84_9EURO|nr:hypothetical protein AJ79_00760 [Helicocarpus griseus UAMH5409]
MVDDEADPDDPVEGSSYTAAYHDPSVPSRRAQQNEHPSAPPPHTDEETEGFTRGDSFFDHFDPMLDADPFGLTASMHFQTPFSYTQNHARQ